MPENDYFSESEKRLATRLGRMRQSEERRALESLAGQGALYGGARQKRMAEVGQEFMDQYMQGVEALEQQRYLAQQAQEQREWQTGERVGSQEWQTEMARLQDQFQQHYLSMGFSHDEAMFAANADLQKYLQQAGFGQEQTMAGLQHQYQLAQMGAGFGYESKLAEQQYGFDIGRMGAQFGYTQQLQQQAEAAKMELQRLVQEGSMTELEAAQAWQEIQNRLAREQELVMQQTNISQEQWMAQFGQEAAMELQGAAQAFEQFLTLQSRDWELTDREWNQLMWLMDAQLQLAIAGYDWSDDGYPGGAPEWMYRKSKQGFGAGYGPEGEKWYKKGHGPEQGGSGGGAGGGHIGKGGGY